MQEGRRQLCDELFARGILGFDNGKPPRSLLQGALWKDRRTTGAVCAVEVPSARAPLAGPGGAGRAPQPARASSRRTNDAGTALRTVHGRERDWFL